jgi:hypothetical protein
MCFNNIHNILQNENFPPSSSSPSTPQKYFLKLPSQLLFSFHALGHFREARSRFRLDKNLRLTEGSTDSNANGNATSPDSNGSTTAAGRTLNKKASNRSRHSMQSDPKTQKLVQMAMDNARQFFFADYKGLKKGIELCAHVSVCVDYDK